MRRGGRGGWGARGGAAGHSRFRGGLAWQLLDRALRLCPRRSSPAAGWGKGTSHSRHEILSGSTSPAAPSGGSHGGDIQAPPGRGPVQPAVGDPASAGELD